MLQFSRFRNASDALIETNRLTLRPYLLNDYQPYLAMCNDAAVVRFLGSGLIAHSQKMTVAARAIAEKKAIGHLS